MSCSPRLALTTLVATLVCSTAAQAQSIACGEPYIVQPGDTLQRIAERAYGPDASFSDLIETNLQRFTNGDPSRIEVGLALDIPCPALVGPAWLEVTPMAVADGMENDPEITRTLALPTDENASPVPPDEIIETLSAAPGVRLAGLVPRPTCGAAGLSAEADLLCTALAWSVPVNEIVLSVFTLADTGPVTRNEALATSSICMAETVPLYLLDTRAPAGSAALTRPANTADCFTALRAGAADAVIAPAPAADSAIATLGPGAAIMEQFALAQLVTLHVVALQEDPAALDLLGFVDRFLEIRARETDRLISGLPE